ncbi:MAG TPA: 7-carboxy-7-deazaguanine synthase QueE [Bacteroidia bacterium]|nr:7-carboxy-7-deazaguanine synthase QueE [Bacteroidia bacterium]
MSSIVSYPVMETFATLQGEGFHTGRAAWFIRLAGCDVGCVWCDVKDSWGVNPEQYRTLEDLITEAEKHKGKIVVITGGEPAMYDLDPLISGLQQIGFNVHLETSGAYPVNGNPDWITVSPKKFVAPLKENIARANELKVIVFNDSDFQWALTHHQYANVNCKYFLQPEFGKFKAVMPKILEFIAENPSWQLSLQTHKFIGIP